MIEITDEHSDGFNKMHEILFFWLFYFLLSNYTGDSKGTRTSSSGHPSYQKLLLIFFIPSTLEFSFQFKIS